MDKLLNKIKNCDICLKHLPHGCRPVVSALPNSKIVIIGQAPGKKVHESGIPWDDASGNNLRKWLGVNDNIFYDNNIFALIPMGFCFPGTGPSGDLPPRKECAPKWHQSLLRLMPEVKLILLIGQYAQKNYLTSPKKNLTTTVQHYQEYLPKFLPLPHPSPRNNIWQKKNPWFATELLPVLKKKVEQII